MGSYCQDMLAGYTTDVQVIFGCEDVEAPPTIIIRSRLAASGESRPLAFSL
jgi:hypothetical protein